MKTAWRPGIAEVALMAALAAGWAALGVYFALGPAEYVSLGLAAAILAFLNIGVAMVLVDERGATKRAGAMAALGIVFVTMAGAPLLPIATGDPSITSGTGGIYFLASMTALLPAAVAAALALNSADRLEELQRHRQPHGR